MDRRCRRARNGAGGGESGLMLAAALRCGGWSFLPRRRAGATAHAAVECPALGHRIRRRRRARHAVRRSGESWVPLGRARRKTVERRRQRRQLRIVSRRRERIDARRRRALSGVRRGVGSVARPRGAHQRLSRAPAESSLRWRGNPTTCSGSPRTSPCSREACRWRPGSTGRPLRRSSADARFTATVTGR